MVQNNLNMLGEILKEKGIKNQFLADRLNITKASVSNYVNNVHQPSIRVLYQIATILNINVTDLLNPDLTILPKEVPLRHKEISKKQKKKKKKKKKNRMKEVLKA
jgi:putative transcriptional regulator